MSDEAMLRADFHQFDADKNGHIDQSEFAALVEFLGAELVGEEAATAFQAIDGNGNGRIEFGEFRQWWLKFQDA